MKKIGKVFKAFFEIIKQPSLLNLIVEREENWRKILVQKHPSFAQGLPVIPISSVMTKNSFEVNPFSFLDGGSLITDLGLLNEFAKQEISNSYFEIGTWRGESVTNVSKYIDECYTLNLSAEEIIQLGNNKKYAEMHGFYSKGNPKITHLEGNSHFFDFKALGKTFDLIFIDGDHHYVSVKNDSQKIFEHLTHENSIVVWHDYTFNPEHIRSEVLLGILDGVPEKFHKNLYHVSNTMCAVFIPDDYFVKTQATKKLSYPNTPETIFQIDVKF